MATVELKDNEWKAFSQKPYAVIDCYGDHCSACVMLAPVFDAVAEELNVIDFGRINITHYSAIADKYNIDAMPTLLFFRGGRLVNTSVGSLDREELLGQLAKLLYE